MSGQVWRVGVIGGLFTLGVLLLGAGAVWQVVGGSQAAAPATAGREDSSTTTEGEQQLAGLGQGAAQTRALSVLHEWDQQRSTAWAAGDPAALRALYTDGSRTGARDVRRLERWIDRGYVVTGLRTQVISLGVVTERPDRLVLRVTDRIVGGVASGSGREITLPRDGATTWRMRFARADDGWLLQETYRRSG